MSGSSVYLLAAGKGRRAGGPKAWLFHENETLLERQIRFLLGRFSPERIAVTIQTDWKERCSNIHREVRWTPEDPEASPLHALQTLMRTAPFDGWSFLYHVDMPVWEDGIFERLERRASDAEKADAILPVHKGKGGHPVLLSASSREAIAGLDPEKDRLDHWLRKQKVERLEGFPAVVHENWNEGRVGAL